MLIANLFRVKFFLVQTGNICRLATTEVKQLAECAHKKLKTYVHPYISIANLFLCIHTHKYLEICEYAPPPFVRRQSLYPIYFNRHIFDDSIKE